MQCLDQIPGAGKWLDPGQELGLEYFSMAFGNRVALGLFQSGCQCRDEHVGALADLLANELRRDGYTRIGKRPVPGSDMKLIAVDERTVNVEQNRIKGHVCRPTCLRPTR